MSFKNILAKIGEWAPTVLATAANPVAGAAMIARKLLADKGDAAAGADDDSVMAAIMGHPEFEVELRKIAIEAEKVELEKQKAAYDMERSKIEADTARISQVNETMRSEAGSNDVWQRRWRPIVALWTFLILFPVMLAMVTWLPAEQIQVADPMMRLMIDAGLAVVGINAFTRGAEKMAAAWKRPDVASAVEKT